VGQRLVVDLPAQPSGHRLDRLAPPLQHQPAPRTLTTGALIGARQRLEAIVREPFQASADRRQLGRCDAPQQLSPGGPEGGHPLTPHRSRANLTEPS
jgi:hypothetical protein